MRCYGRNSTSAIVLCWRRAS